MNIRIKNLRLRTIIGINDWERVEKQDIVINLELELDGIRAMETDRIEDTVNYKSLTKRVISEVEKSEFYLIEKMAEHILQVVLEDTKIKKATVEVDKPGALSYADSVSVCCSAGRE